MSDIYQSLIPLIRKKSTIADPEKFHDLVNVIFHDFESKHYDELHREMWESLPQQYAFLINDIEAHVQNRANLKLLDIGCGTGLATALLLRTALGPKVSDVHLLDTSAKMLGEARKRADSWGKKIKTINGDIAQIDAQYDVIIISSVLHHIPDLAGFLAQVTAIQKTGGLLITIHDPAGEATLDEVYNKRVKEYQEYSARQRAKNKRPLLTRIKGRLKNIFKPADYISQINKKLLRENVITEPLTATELWSVTDIHVEGLPYSIGKGITRDMLTENLKKSSLLTYRTYGFFGMLASNLDDEYKVLEHSLSVKKDGHGRHFCSAWLKNTN